MDDTYLREFKFNIENDQDAENLVKVSRALSSLDRVKILKLLNKGPLSVLEISQKLDLPFSTVANHINVLEDARLIMVEFTPTFKGHQKLCSRMVTNYHVDIWSKAKKKDEIFTFEMPIGMFVDAKIHAPCGMASEERHLMVSDQVEQFYNTERAKAQILWFKYGYITYRFPLNNIKKSKISEINLELELCSETAYYKENWPSDITFSFNNIEIGSFLSLGDYGKKRGILNPSWWSDSDTQHGVLVSITINNQGTYINNKMVNGEVKVQNIIKNLSSFLELKIEIKEDAEHVGGINLFGKRFGNYSQDIILKFKVSS